MEIENANDHPFKVEIVKGSKFFANSHPFKVEVVGGGGGDVQDFVGATTTTIGEHGLVPAPQAGDNTKFLKGDGSWAEVSGGSEINVVQTTGTSTTDVMSQNAVTEIMGQAKVLTSADLNWNSTTQTAVEPFDSMAMWLLSPGLYELSSTEGVTIYTRRDKTGPKYSQGTFWVGKENSSNYYPVLVGGQTGYSYLALDKNGSFTGSTAHELLSSLDIKNNLTTTASGYSLDARQGKVLNDKVVAIQNQLSGLESALNVINNGSGN